MPRIPHDELQSFARSLLAAAGAPAREAGVVAESLLGANLRGFDSHGVMRIPQYVASIRSGEIRPASRLQVINETAALTVCDGNWGFGQVLARELSAKLIDQAHRGGAAAGTLRHSAHIGRLGEYAEQAAAAGLLSLIFANTHGAARRVAPPGGTRPRLGTNPICLGCPGGKDGPFILDFGTSATAEGKVRLARIAGEQVPAGWLLDPEGNPTTDPNVIYGNPPGTILPAGGDQAYKGFGLALLIELFCSGLAGAPAASSHPSGPKGNAAFFLFVSPGHAAGAAHLKAEARSLERYLRDVPLRAGVDRVILPGDLERAELARRSAEGIPFEPSGWETLCELARSLNVAIPQA